ncbi:MAG: RDD family protein [Bacilli bacterium]|nr:RDD family protein [Bacilli bacterium]
MIIAKKYKRILAYVVDLFLLSLFLILVYFLLLHDSNITDIIKQAFNDFKNGDMNFQDMISIIYSVSNKHTFLLFLIYLMYCFLYFVFMPMVFEFQTFGRFLFKVRVRKLNETKLSFGTLFLREIVGKGLFTIFTLGITNIVSFVMIFTSRSGRTIHDRIANTVVVGK